MMWNRKGCVAFGVFSLTWALSPAPSGAAKPPDLPVELKIRCEESTTPVATEAPSPSQGGERSQPSTGRWNLDLDLFSWRLTVAVEPKAQPGLGETSIQSFVPLLFERLCERLAAVGHEAARNTETTKRKVSDGAGTREEAIRGGRVAAPDVDEVLSDRALQARTMFEIAERCRSKGDLAKARTCYEETHLLSPSSRFGREAMRRLAEIDGGRGDGSAEEESNAGTEEEPPLYRDPLRGGDKESRRHEEMLRNTQPLGVVAPDWIHREVRAH